MEYLFLILPFFCYGCTDQNNTAVSLFLRADSSVYLTEIASETGDLFNDLGHHGPAIENEWLGLRYYFDKKAAIDVYSKSRKGLELREARWYPSIEQQENGWGADYYKVGSTVGLGGIRLWDGEKVIPLDPVTNRSARVVKQGSTSKMEIRSENIPCKGVRLISLFVLLFFPENGRPRLKQSHWVMTLYSLLQESIIMMDKK